METLETRKRRFVRDEIWDAAIDLFAERGFENTTIEDIAHAAGVSRRSFFRYFSSKNELMAQGIVMYGTALAGAIAACPRTCAPMEVVRRAVLHIATAAAGQPRTRKIMEIADRNPAARDALRSRTAELEDSVAQAYIARCRNGDDLTPRLLAGLTLSILDVTFRQWFDHGGQDIPATAGQVFAALGRLVSPTKPRPSRRDRLPARG